MANNAKKLTFVSMYASGHNILLMDSTRELYLAGSNYYGKCSLISEQQVLTDAQKINISLESDEEIKVFKAYLVNICIYTTKNRLYLFYSRLSGCYNHIQLPSTNQAEQTSDDLDIDPDEGNLDMSATSKVKLPFISFEMRRSSKKDYKAEFLKIQNQLQQTEMPNAHVSPTSREVGSWTPLRTVDFHRLNDEARSLYIRCARFRISHDMESDNTRNREWLQQDNGSLLAEVIAQLEMPFRASNPAPTSGWIDTSAEDDNGSVASVSLPYIASDSTSTGPLGRSSIRASLTQVTPVATANPVAVVAVTASIKKNSRKKSKLPKVAKPISDFILSPIPFDSASFVGIDPARRIGYDGSRRQFDLLENIPNVIFGQDVIMYERDNSFFVEIFNYHQRNVGNSELYAYGRLAMIPEIQMSGLFQVNLPSSDGKYTFTSSLLHVKQNNIHHVLVPYANSEACIHWIYFKSELDIDPKSIHFSELEKTIYVIHDNICYRYYRPHQELVPFMSCDAMYGFAKHACSEEFFAIDVNYLKIGGGLKTSSPNHDFMKNLTGVYFIQSNSENATLNKMLETSHIIVVHTTEITSSYKYERIVQVGGILCVNVRNIRYWNMLNDICFVFVENNSLHVLNRKGQFIRSTECRHINTIGNTSYCTYPLPILDSDIESIIMNGSIIIRTKKGNIFCAHFFEQFVFRQIDILPRNRIIKVPRLVNVKNVPGMRMSLGSNAIETTIQIGEKCYPKLYSMAELMDVNTEININQNNGIERVARGSGAKRAFIDQALREFAEAYLIQHNSLTSLNVQALRELKDNQLYVIGKMLVWALNASRVYLSIRIPTIVYAAVARTLPTKMTLEYFAHKEDPEAYFQLKQIENSPEALKDAGYDDYMQGLLTLCKFDRESSGKTGLTESEINEEYERGEYEIARKIADGILNHANIAICKLNLATLDYYFSGDYTINVDRLTEFINFGSSASNYKSTVLSIIKKLSESQLRSLIRNWTGTSAVNYSNIQLEVHVSDSNINQIVDFHTCNRLLTINPRLFTEYPESTIIDFLVSDCKTMKDRAE